MPNASRAATLEPKSSDAITHIGTKAREAPPWWHADLCEDQEHTRLDKNQKMKILGKDHETPRQDHCWGRPRRRGKTLAGAPARPLPKTSAGPQPGPHLPKLRRRSHAAASPPTRRTRAWRRAASRPTQQAPAWWHADLREDFATAPTQQPASQRGTTRLVGSDTCRGQSRPAEAATAGTSFLTVLDKARRACRQRIKCVCPMVPGDRLDYCTTFHLLCATVAAPFDYKRTPAAY